MNGHDEIAVVSFSGELEISRKNEIRDALAGCENDRYVVLDLAGVTYADSIALTELLRFCAEAERAQRAVALVVQTPQFARLVQYAGLANAFKIFNDVADARSYLLELRR